MSENHNEERFAMGLQHKTKYFIRILLITAGVYFAFQYLLKLFLPFVFAYAISYFLSPMVEYFVKRTKVRRSIIAIIVLGTVVVCFALLMGIILTQLFNQALGVLNHIGYYEGVMEHKLRDLCDLLEVYVGASANEIYGTICKTTREFVTGFSRDAIIKLMGTSANTIRFFVELFIFLFTTILASFYMIVSREEIKRKRKESIFYKEITRILGNVYQVSVTYIRTQLIIMLFTTIVCYVGLLIIKNPYALVIAVLIGLMDALPMLGVGIVLIPWCIILVLTKQYVYGMVLLVLFIVCYGFRELAEPRLMGKGIGISPLMTILSMYVGLNVFGISGVVLGPIAYVVLKTINGEEEVKRN